MKVNAKKRKKNQEIHLFTIRMEEALRVRNSPSVGLRKHLQTHCAEEKKKAKMDEFDEGK